MKDRLDALDGRLRAALLRPASPRALHACAGLTCAAFFLLLMTRTLTQAAGRGQQFGAALMLTLPLALMLFFAVRLTKESEGGVLGALCACALCACALLARLSFLERSSGDYDLYLADWLSKLAAGSFSDGMRQDIGEYNVLYQYILFGITRLPVPALYAVKAVSFMGDALLAGAAARLCSRNGRGSLPVFGAVLLLPTVVLNGGMFAQCDSLYAACALWGLACCLQDRPARGAACFALALAFKLQAVFLLPIAAVLWADRRLRVLDAGVFLLTLAAAALPAVLGGKSPAALVSIYASQTGLYTGLNYNAPGFFGLMETAGLDVYAYGNFAMAIAFGVCALLVAFGIRRAGNLSRTDYVRLALLLPLWIVFCLPRMHERYFYLADVLSVALAGCDRRMIPAAALIALASLSSYWALAIPLPLASGMMLAAAVIALAGAMRGEDAHEPRRDAQFPEA